MIDVKIIFDENKYIKEISIEGHATKVGEFSIECSVLSTLSETLFVAFKDIFKNSKVEKDKGKLKILILEKDKKKREEIERFLYPFIVMFKKTSNDFKNIVNLQIEK